MTAVSDAVGVLETCGTRQKKRRRRMKKKDMKGQSPSDLRELATRTRFLAAHLDEPDKSRLEAYAAELEKVAEQLERPH